MDLKPSCESCPSFLRKEDVPSKFKRATGSAMCGRFGIPLNRPGATDPTVIKQQREHFAATCGAHGEPMPVTPLERRYTVALPDPVARSVGPSDEMSKVAVATCNNCQNYVRPDVVAEQWGWTVGFCAAKGRLVPTDQLKVEAKDCDFRTYGGNRQTLEGMHLFPEYEDDFGKYDPVKEFLKNGPEKVTDPNEYESDIEVSEEDAADGIKAWRKVTDPESGNSTFLPIYRRDYFDIEQQLLIPQTGDAEHPELYVDHFRGVYLAAVCWAELDETPALWGQPGTGKTELFRHLAWLMQVPFRRISITGSTELDDLAGKMMFSKEQGTYFQHGRLPQAWTSPGVLCVDEPNTGAPDVWQFLRPLTDNSKQLVLDMNKGEVLTRTDSCYLGMAMNPSWDAKNVGTIEISDADANRLFHVHIDIPPEEVEVSIIKERVKLDGWELNATRIKFLMDVARDLRDLSNEGTIPVSWAVRPQIKVARALRWFGPLDAYKRAVGDYLEPEAREALLDVVRRHLPS